MAKKAAKIDELIEALLDQRVQEALAANTSGSLALMVEELLNKKLENVLRTCTELKRENAVLKLALATAEKSIESIVRTNADLCVRLDSQECFSRRENIVIRGLPEVSYAEVGSCSGEGTTRDDIPNGSTFAVEQSVITLCRDKLGINIDLSDISSAHRIKKGERDSVRPVLVRFVCAKTKDLIMRAKKKLKTDGSRIYISEHLTKSASTCFYNARKLVREKKIASAWSMNGQIFFKKTTASTEKPTLMTAELSF